MPHSRSLRNILCALILLALITTPAFFAPVTTVKAVSPQPKYLWGISSYLTQVNYPVNFKGDIYFFARSYDYGMTLWRSAGTPGDVTLIKDIHPGDDSVSGYLDTQVQVSGNTLYFAADNGVNGTELWATDGSTSGTRLVLDINQGSTGSDPRQMVDVDGTLFFTATDAQHGTQVWKSDGTASGTWQVSTFGSGSDGLGYENSLAAFNHRLALFTNNDTGGEAWLFDPAANRWSQFYSTGNGAWYIETDLFNGSLYFSTGRPDGGQLYRTDGTSAGTILVAQGLWVNSSHAINAAGSNLFFLGKQNNSISLWRITSGNETPQLMKALGEDYDPNTGHYSYFSFDPMGALGNRLFFNKDSYLWVSDGSPAGTTQVLSATGEVGLSNSDYAVLNGRMFFASSFDDIAITLWSTDGTSRGTHPEFDSRIPEMYYTNPRYMTAFNGKLFLAMDRGSFNDQQPWIYDPGSSSMLAYPDFGGDDENTPNPVVIDVLANDHNLLGGQVRLASFDANSDSGASITRDTRGTPNDLTDDRLIYTPLHNFFGYDAFQYTIQDGMGNSDSTYVVVNMHVSQTSPIQGVDLAPYAIEEHSPAGSEVGSLMVNGPSGMIQPACSLNNPKNLPFQMTGDRVYTTQPLDYETQNRYTVHVRCLGANQEAVFTSFVIFVYDNDDKLGLDPIYDIQINSDAGQHTVNLYDIHMSQGASGPVTITTASSNPALLPNPTVQYSGGTSGALALQPTAGAAGKVTITVTLNDGINTLERAFQVTLANSLPPSLDPLPDIQISSFGGPQTVTLTGISIRSGADGPISFNTMYNYYGPLSVSSVQYSGGSTGSLTLVPYPGQAGQVTITITISDGLNSADRQFTVTVTNPQPPSLDPLPDIQISSAAGSRQVDLTGIHIDPQAGGPVTITAGSSNTNIIPDPTVQYSGGSTGALTLAPKFGQAGQVTITVTVNDGMHSTDRQFTVTVTNPQPPTLDPLPDIQFSSSGGSKTLSLTGILIDPQAGGPATITATSSNPDLVPNPTVQYSGGSTGSLTLSPYPGVAGETTITITVSDGRNSIDRKFKAMVTNPQAPALDPLPDIQINSLDGPQNVPLTGIRIDPQAGGPATITATSSSPDIIPTLTVQYSGGSTGVLVLQPAVGAEGKAIITVNVSDGMFTTGRSFTVTLTPKPFIYLPCVKR